MCSHSFSPFQRAHDCHLLLTGNRHFRCSS
jgi:hypothetical protein